MQNKTPTATFWIALGAVVAAIAVLTSAFGAHGLERVVAEMDDPDKRLANWSTAARFQMYHGLALVLCGILPALTGPSRCYRTAAWLSLIGVGLFSGGLYLWVFLDQTWMVQIVPLGGLSFVVSWLMIAVGAVLTGKVTDRHSVQKPADSTSH